MSESGDSTMPIPPPESSAGQPTLLAGVREHAADHPRQIGRYQILGVLGEGGMGVVYQARQSHPVKRTVALKLIKLGMDTKEVIARFESERQALAMMNHPNVAKVLDAGTSDNGRPYFVMEYVPGVPITAYCDQQNLPIRDRLELFIQACQAIEHAHQKALIHRDLKPSNILVMLEDARPLVKVIDFGVAKATNQRLTERTLFTHHGQLIGTPEYMSPEQAEMSALDVDTRSDIYSLGVVLYELLVGALPFDSKTLRSAAYNEIHRIIREVEPPRPSTRISSLGASAADVARRRRTQVDSLSRQLRSELEWIPLKAMRKDRAQRYNTASEMAQDIRNYLEQRPLLAGPESPGYRLRKFLRRNKRGVAASAAMILLLVGGIIGTSVALIGQSRARAEAERQRAEAERQRLEAQTANEGMQAVNEFLTEQVIGSAAPEVTLGRELSVREALDNAANGIDQKFNDRPLIHAAISNSVARAYKALGRADLGIPHARAALEARTRVLGDAHPDALTSITLLATILHDQGKWDESEPLFREALEKTRRIHGNEHPHTLTALSNLSYQLQDRGRLSDAEPLAREALEIRRRLLGDEHPQTLVSMNNLATLLNDQHKLPEAEALYRECLQTRREVLGEDHPETLVTMNNLALLLYERRKLPESEALSRESLLRCRRVLGEEHPRTMTAVNNLAWALQEQGKLAEAEKLCADALAVSRRMGREDEPRTLALANNLASLLVKQGKLAEAEPIRREVMQRCQRTLGRDHPSTIGSMVALAALLRDQQRDSDAEPLMREIYELCTVARLHPSRAAVYMSLWGPCLVRLERYAEAEPVLLESHRRLVVTQQQQTVSMREVLAALMRTYERSDKPEEAAKWRAELQMLAPATQPSTSPADSL